jgi:hypothetical protein
VVVMRMRLLRGRRRTYGDVVGKCGTHLDVDVGLFVTTAGRTCLGSYTMHK